MKADMKNVTLTADETLIEAARARARSAQTTLNDEFRRWLADYAGAGSRIERVDTAVSRARGKLTVGARLSRDERNAR